MALSNLIWLIIIWIISAIPLNLAVKLIGGKSSIIKVIFVNFLVAVASALLYQTFGLFAVIFSFLAMLLIYKIMFKIGWFRAFLAWILQFILVAIFVVVLLMFGVSLLLI